MREAACIGIGQFAQYLQPDIIGHYEQAMPRRAAPSPDLPPTSPDLA